MQLLFEVYVVSEAINVRKSLPSKGGFPIEIETKISRLITYSYFYVIKIAKLYVISFLILVSISIGNPPIC